MNYGIAAVHLDFAKEACIRTARYFRIPGTHSPEQVSSISTWLLKGYQYHHSEVDLEARTASNVPFKSPLLGLLLRGYFIEGGPKQDEILIESLKREKCIPLPLIAMTATLIGHSILQYSSGYKIENDLLAGNLAGHYRWITLSLSQLEEMTPAYFDHLQRFLYSEMMSSGPEVIPPQVYDYDALTKLVSNGTAQPDPAAGNDEDDVPDGDGQDLATASQ
ncbi:hypothetical protein GYMLUDRAFT_252223 [Collybiopsis luxurians FD-317 M1]|uniref:DUF6532 domain-containing protein n=1 Tax=Collybiopsis luxurians FD-317 M1 TaxID=944289 RepID=A0A0D0C0T0_9AGAR|nr:hypothetical protein GYMLUDRAFT_252223 [Collybiopsis luxurians FD-317 M1]